eukprot:4913044-Pyramimonas_sp.AAC.1
MPARSTAPRRGGDCARLRGKSYASTDSDEPAALSRQCVLGSESDRHSASRAETNYPTRRCNIFALGDECILQAANGERTVDERV